MFVLDTQKSKSEIDNNGTGLLKRRIFISVRMISFFFTSNLKFDVPSARNESIVLLSCFDDTRAMGTLV